MKKSNINFIEVNNILSVSKSTVDFNEDVPEIPVNEETRILLCVGNCGNNKLKVQFSVMEGCDQYEIRSEPQLIL